MKYIISILTGVALFGLGYVYGNTGFDWQSFARNQVTNADVPAGIATDVSFESFWKAWSLLDENIAPNKVGSSSTSTIITNQEKVWGAIQGLAASYGDPYTTFFPPAQSKAFAESVKGEFGGVGMEVGVKDGIITVIAPLKKTPAERAGIRPNDRIIKIGEESTENLSLDKAITLMRGEPGTPVTLTLFRESERRQIEITVIRAKIEVPIIETEYKQGVFIIRLFSFTETSARKFQEAIQEFAKYPTNKLILDLRGNPGGYLEQAVDIASFFLPEGKTIVSEEGNRHYENKVYRSRGFNVFNDSLRLVVLIDGGSASASEILAAALRDHGKAKIVGEKSFGKGSVQQIFEVTKDTSLKVTIARWLTPNGTSISNGGVMPDVVVPASTSTDVVPPPDVQLEKAIELLLENK